MFAQLYVRAKVQTTQRVRQVRTSDLQFARRLADRIGSEQTGVHVYLLKIVDV